MALQNITPQLQAEERTAQFHLHPVPIQNGLAQTGRMLTDAGQGLQKASFGLMLGLKRQKDEMDAREDALALAEAKNGYINEMAKKTTGLMQKSGTEARGITGQYEIDSGNAFNRWQTGLSMKASREFKLWADQQHLTGWQRVQGYELSNVKGAQLEQGKQLLASDAQMFSTHGDFRTLAMLTQDAAAHYELQFGATEDQEALDKYVQGYIDQAYGARMDYLLDRGLIAQAEEFYDSLGQSGMPAPSGAIQNVMRDVLDRKQGALMLQYDASALVTDVLAAAGGESMGGQFTTPEQVQAAAQVERRLSESTDPKDKERLSNFRNLYGAKLKEQSANLAAGISSSTYDLFKNVQDLTLFASSLSVLKSRIDGMPPSMLRSELESMYAKYNKAYLSDVKTRMNEMQTAANRLQTLANSERTEQKRKMDEYKKDPARLAYAGALLNQACLSNPSVTIGHGYSAKTFYLRDEKQCAAAVSYLNMRNGGPLTDEECWKLEQLGTGKMSSQDRADATARVGRLFQTLGYSEGDNPDNIALAAPWLIDFAIQTAQRYTNDGKVKGKEVSDAIDRAVLEELDREFSAPSWFWGFGNGGRAFFSAAKIISKAIKSDGTIDFDYLEQSFGNFANPSSVVQAETNPDVDRRINEERAKLERGLFGGRGTTISDFAEQQRGVR